ncbi:MAG: alpha-methylacyl-CoA racemase [Arenicella sp.]|jgi:alpha-methylacyl-CoA racemase
MGPLAGLKVIEMSAIGPVPLAGMLLADMGADVVIIDKANDPYKMPGDVLRRGKRSIEVDMKSDEGVATTRTLIEHADIVIEGFRPGVMERLGIGPEIFEQTNPKLIYGRMTGWGQTGPLSQAAGHDINYIAITGALNAIGRQGSAPVPPLNLVGDYGGGTMFLIMGVLAALHESKTSGKGQVVDAAITEGTANLMSMFYTMSNIGAWTTRRASNLLDSAAHFYDSYETSDSKFITLGSIEPHFYALMKEKMSLSEEDFGKQNDPRKWPELKAKLTIVVATKTQKEWCDIMEGTDVCFAPVLDFLEAPEHHHMQARQAYLEIDGNVQPAPAPKFSRTASEIKPSEKYTESSILDEWLKI